MRLSEGRLKIPQPRKEKRLLVFVTKLKKLVRLTRLLWAKIASAQLASGAGGWYR
jgi:hypothetical protein